MQNIENYKKEKLTINLVWANVFSFIIFLPTILLFTLPYYLIWGINSHGFIHTFSPIKSIYILVVLILGIVVHELIHGIFWAIFAKKGFHSIKFGVLWVMLTPYCHCKEPLKVKHYIIGAIMPAVLLGFLPAILSIIIGNVWFLIFGIFFTIAAAGDFLIVNLLRKENRNDLVQDHPSEAGCYIYRKLNSN